MKDIIQRSGQGGMLFYCQDDEVTFENDLKGLRKRVMKMSGGRAFKAKKSKYKGPEVETCLVCLGNSMIARTYVL